LPSAVFSLARGTAISIGPNVPVRDRVRLPWRSECQKETDS
jgi:hypothetical protein